MQFQPDIHAILHPLNGRQDSWVMEWLFPLLEAQQQEMCSKLISFSLWNCSGLLPAGSWLAGTRQLLAFLKHDLMQLIRVGY